MTITEYFQKHLSLLHFPFTHKHDGLHHSGLGLTLKFSTQASTDQTILIQVHGLHPKFTEGDFVEFAFGLGKDVEEATDRAASHWVNNEFVVLHAYLCGNDPGVKVMETVSQTGSDQHGWDILLGPVQCMNDSTVAGAPELNEENLFDMYACLRNSMAAYLWQEQFLYVKCFALKSSNGNIEVDCRLNGVEWPEGKEDIRAFANTWEFPGGFHSRKQFFIMHPVPIEGSERKKKLAFELRQSYEGQAASVRPEHNTKKWFEFWK